MWALPLLHMVLFEVVPLPGTPTSRKRPKVLKSSIREGTRCSILPFEWPYGGGGTCAGYKFPKMGQKQGVPPFGPFLTLFGENGVYKGPLRGGTVGGHVPHLCPQPSRGISLLTRATRLAETQNDLEFWPSDGGQKRLRACARLHPPKMRVHSKNPRLGGCPTLSTDTTRCERL